MLFNGFCLWLSYKMLNIFGPGDFSRVNLIGNYAVGYMKFYLKNGKGNAVSVFYPVDKEFEADVLRNKMKQLTRKLLTMKTLKDSFRRARSVLNGFSKPRRLTPPKTYNSLKRSKCQPLFVLN